MSSTRSLRSVEELETIDALAVRKLERLAGFEIRERLLRAVLPRDNAAAQRRSNSRTHRRIAYPHRRFGRQCEAQAEAAQATTRN